jgi:hypothetical protein
LSKEKKLFLTLSGIMRQDRVKFFGWKEKRKEGQREINKVENRDNRLREK